MIKKFMFTYLKSTFNRNSLMKKKFKFESVVKLETFL